MSASYDTSSASSGGLGACGGVIGGGVAGFGVAGFGVTGFGVAGFGVAGFGVAGGGVAWLEEYRRVAPWEGRLRVLHEPRAVLLVLRRALLARQTERGRTSATA